jgi:hypothetical protein
MTKDRQEYMVPRRYLTSASSSWSITWKPKSQSTLIRNLDLKLLYKFNNLEDLALDKLTVFVDTILETWCIINKVVVYAAITTDAAAKTPNDSDISTKRSKKAQKNEKLTASSSTP